MSWSQEHVFSFATYFVQVHNQFDAKKITAEVKYNVEIILLNLKKDVNECTCISFH